MLTVRDMLNDKGREVWSIAPDATVHDAVALMEDKQVGALTVLDGDRLVGIISERDCARKVILLDKSSREMKVADIMTEELVSVGEDASVDECMAQMASNRIRHLPVVDDNGLIGIVAVGDVMKFTIREQSTVIEELESYVKDEEGGSG